MKNKERDLLASVVGAAKSGVVAVVSGENDEIFGGDGRDEVAQPPIEFLQSFAVSQYIASVTIKHIEVHKVHENETIAF